MSIKRIAITQRVVENDTYAELRDALAHDWSDFFAGLYPAAALLPVPNCPENVRPWFEEVRPDVIVFSNGNDWGASQKRDQTERSLFELGCDRRTPMLGVCRGLQVLNLFLGGSIEADISPVVNEEHVVATHSVVIVDDYFIRLIGESVQVNSYHNQGVVESGCSPNLRVFARTPGGAIEGLYHPDLPVLAIQWHPEREECPQVMDSMIIRKLFEEGAHWRGAA